VDRCKSTRRADVDREMRAAHLRTRAMQAPMPCISAVDLVARVLFEEITAEGGEAILLKGASFASTLYEDDEAPRLSVDVDLLVPAGALEVVASVLHRRGYFASGSRARGDHATTWRREGLPAVDVHDTLGGLRAPPERVWKALRKHRRPLQVAGGSIPTLDLPALALHVAVHATQHGQATGRTITDLQRALVRIDDADWCLARELARDLDGLDSFATGLRLVPAGRELAERLGIPPVDSAIAAARAENASGRARLLAHVSDARGLSARLWWIRWAIVPPRVVMREWYPDQPLGTAYIVRRPLRVVMRTPRAMRELKRVRRATRDRG